MPLDTSVERGGRIVQLIWDWPMLSIALTACLAEACPEVLDEITEGRWSEHKEVTVGDETYETYVDLSMAPLYHVPWPVPVLREGSQTLQNDHRFYVSSRLDEDRREVILKKGDVVRMSRSYN